jgi:hypothetical protein
MEFLRIRDRKDTWIVLFLRRLNDLIRSDADNELRKANRKIIPGGVLTAGALEVEKRISSSKRSGFEPSPSTAEIALWQLLLRN